MPSTCEALEPTFPGDMPLALTAALAQKDRSFASLPRSATHDVLGVRYVHVRTNEGDDLLLTEHGWPWLAELLPENWHRNGLYKKVGTRLRFSTGAVYRVPITHPRRLQIVAKFSRIGQYLDAGHLIESDLMTPNDDPSFLSPFEEIANLEQLRHSPGSPRILTKRALGVFSPHERYKDWQLGRIPHHFDRHARRVAEGQTDRDDNHAILLDPNRSYLTLFQWLKGLNLEECVEQGLLDRASAESINRMVLDDLHRKGFKVLDHKANHVIVSFTRGGSLLKRRGRVIYGLADFELLSKRNPDTESEGLAGSQAVEQPAREGQGSPLAVRDHGVAT